MDVCDRSFEVVENNEHGERNEEEGEFSPCGWRIPRHDVKKLGEVGRSPTLTRVKTERATTRVSALGDIIEAASANHSAE